MKSWLIIVITVILTDQDWQDHVATKMQALFGKFKQDKAVRKIQELCGWRQPRKDVKSKKVKQDKAATKIQALFRGRQVRKPVKWHKLVMIEKIQAVFRGHAVRRKLKGIKTVYIIGLIFSFFFLYGFS